ncbi:MAG: ATP synthase F1 subunit gamma [Vicinamibacteria bacterium]|nr:ATP synthase F1 subunit gamma [Vicinamibacteria bacterium]
MPALIDIRRRIRSVRNTEQITKAMKMVSAAKLRRAQESMFAARPYARKMMEVLNSLAARADPAGHPLLAERAGDRLLIVIITADKGLCGGFNAAIVRAATEFLGEQRERDIALTLVGRKGREHFRRRDHEIRSEHVGLFQKLQYASARRIAAELIEIYTRGEIDQVFLVFNEFKTVIQQRVVVERLLPIEKLTPTGVTSPFDYVYEPEPGAIFDRLLPKYVEIQVWHALLESAAAEHGARMSAMDAATNNAGEMIDRLTLYMNKVRQAAITKEIIEVVSGAGGD